MKNKRIKHAVRQELALATRARVRSRRETLIKHFI